jgi:Putative addiction module component
MTQDVVELLRRARALLADEEWKEEIARRIRELDSGKVKPIPWAEARR